MAQPQLQPRAQERFAYAQHSPGEMEDTSFHVENEVPESTQEHEKKKSMLGKVKNKAQKLKTKIRDASGKRSEDKDHNSGDGEDEGATTDMHEHRTLPPDEGLYDETCAGLKGIKLDESKGQHGPVHGGDAAAKALSALESFGTRNMFEGDARPKDLPKQAHPADPSRGASSTRTGGMEESSPSGMIPPLHGAGIPVNKVSERNLPPLPNSAVAGGAPALSGVVGDHILKVGREGDSARPMDLSSDKPGKDAIEKSTEVSEPAAEQPSWTGKTLGTLSAAKDAAISKLGYGGKEGEKTVDQREPTKTSQNFQGDFSQEDGSRNISEESTESKPLIDHATEGLSSAKDKVVGASLAAAGAISSAIGWAPIVASQDGMGDRSMEETGKMKSDDQSRMETNESKGQSWSDLAFAKVSSAKDAIKSMVATVPEQSEGGFENLPQREKPKDDQAVELKETSASKLGYNSSTSTESSEKPSIEKVDDKTVSAAVAEDAPASNFSYGQERGQEEGKKKTEISTTATSESLGQKMKKTVSGKVSQVKEVVISAKDSTASVLTPGEEEMALSQKITELLSPSHMKERVGGMFKGSSQDAPTSPQAKGIFSKVTDVVGSLFKRMNSREKEVKPESAQGSIHEERSSSTSESSLSEAPEREITADTSQSVESDDTKDAAPSTHFNQHVPVNV